MFKVNVRMAGTSSFHVETIDVNSYCELWELQQNYNSKNKKLLLMREKFEAYLIKNEIYRPIQPDINDFNWFQRLLVFRRIKYIYIRNFNNYFNKRNSAFAEFNYDNWDQLSQIEWSVFESNNCWDISVEK